MWLLGRGLTDAAGDATAAGLTVGVTHGGTVDVTVKSVTPRAPCSPTNSSCTTSSTLQNLTFQIVVSRTAQLGNRDLVVTLGNGETQVYMGAIQIIE